MEKIKLQPSVRTSGGNPNGLPDFRPINKLPESEIRAVAKRVAQRLVQSPKYQVWVEELRSHSVIPVGPKGLTQDQAANFAFAIADQIRKGNEKAWGSPQIKLCL